MLLSLSFYAGNFLFIWLLIRFRAMSSREPRLPPGPPTIPVLGNLHIFPKRFAYRTFTQWASVYGEIFSLKLGSGVVIVLNSPRLVREFLDTRSATTSDRPPTDVADVIAGGLNVVMARYGPKWRSIRRTAHELLTREACMRHLPVQRAEATQLMYDILKQPKDFYTHIVRNSASVILSVAFGVRCPRYESSLISKFFAVQREWEHILAPGAVPPMDMVPILKFIPERWAPWKSKCREIRFGQRKLYFYLLHACEKRIAEHRRNGCFMETVIDDQEKYRLDHEMLGYLGGILMEAGTDTTAMFLQALVFCMVAHPEAQTRAQAEIDKVIGAQRIPTFDDIDNLPYVNAIIKEVHRFRPVTPVGIPHATTADEILDSYVIPRGSTVFMNIWGIGHDKDSFDNPDVFNPDRFIQSEFGTKEGVDTIGCRHDMPFGSGRRICPGMHLANNSLILNTMNLLWAFNFHPAKDLISKEPLLLDLDDMTDGILSAPKPFRCDITPRSKTHADLIQHEFREARSIFSQFEQELSADDLAYFAEW